MTEFFNALTHFCGLSFMTVMGLMMFAVVALVYNSRPIRSKICGFVPDIFRNKNQVAALNSIRLIVEKLANDINMGWYDEKDKILKEDVKKALEEIKEKIREYSLDKKTLRTAKREICGQLLQRYNLSKTTSLVPDNKRFSHSHSHSF